MSSTRIRDVVEALAARREELVQTPVGAGGSQELDVGVADVEQHGLDALVSTVSRWTTGILSSCS